MGERPVAFIGLGAMGTPMARRLSARFPLHLHDSDPAVLAQWEREATSECQVFAAEPVSTRSLGDRARELGIGYVDAPVSGGVAGAEAGALTAIVGGQECEVRAVEPLIACMTGTLFHVGGPGAGHAVKALNNLLSAVGIAITTEAIEIGSRFGIDPQRMIEVFNSSSGRNYATEYKFPNFVLKDQFTSGFRLGLQCKDLDAALGLAATCGVSAPVADAAAHAWHDAEAALGPEADHTEFARPRPSGASLRWPSARPS